MLQDICPVQSKCITQCLKATFGFVAVHDWNNGCCSSLTHCVNEPVGRGFDYRWGHWDFYWLNLSGCTGSLGSTQRLTEMSTKDFFLGVKTAGT
jgi:hypothetical protein